MSRRMIHPPGGQSSIFMGDEPAPLQTPPQAAIPEQTKGGEASQKSQESVKRQTEESADNAFANAQGTNAERKGSNGQVQTSQTESARNKDKQKSNIIFGEESASESAAQNKKGQSSHGYNLITGESDFDSDKRHNSRSQTNGNQAAAKPEAATTTSTKVHHPPGGKSSGPLW